LSCASFPAANQLVNGRASAAEPGGVGASGAARDIGALGAQLLPLMVSVEDDASLVEGLQE
jgi:hypothetical protein